MKYLMLVSGVLLVASVGLVSAQIADSAIGNDRQTLADAQRRLWGYGFVGPSLDVADITRFKLHRGGGVEWRFLKPLGVGAEAVVTGYGAGLLSLNGYHYVRDVRAGDQLLVLSLSETRYVLWQLTLLVSSSSASCYSSTLGSRQRMINSCLPAPSTDSFGLP